MSERAPDIEITEQGSVLLSEAGQEFADALRLQAVALGFAPEALPQKAEVLAAAEALIAEGGAS